MVEILHLPLSEAAAAAQSQLSATGKTAQLPSRRMLIISDDSTHIEQAVKLLKQLDTAPAQLAVSIEIAEFTEQQAGGARIKQLHLPGGWIRLALSGQSGRSNNRRSFMLRTSSGSAGHIEGGEIHIVDNSVRRYLTAHGIVSQSNVELIDVTGGFDVRATLLGKDQVRVSIHPWLRRMDNDASMQAKTELLLDAGSTQGVKLPPSPDAPLRINVQPVGAVHQGRIMVSEASTELTLPLGERVRLATNDSAAAEFSNALLGPNSFNKKNQLSITVSVNKAGP